MTDDSYLKKKLEEAGIHQPEPERVVIAPVPSPLPSEIFLCVDAGAMGEPKNFRQRNYNGHPKKKKPISPEGLEQQCTSPFSPKRDALQRVFRAARDIILGAAPASELPGRPFEALKLDVVSVCGVTPAAYGLDSDRSRAAQCPRSDFAVLRNYHNGWGKAELEGRRRCLDAFRPPEADGADESRLQAA